MTFKPNHKTWIAPIIAIVFVSVATTGILKAFDIEIPGTKEVHGLLGLLLAITGITHLILNWKVLVFYLKSHRAALIGLIVAVFLVSVLVALGVHATLTRELDNGGPRRAETATALELEDWN